MAGTTGPRTAIVTGAAGGIGRAIATRLALDGLGVSVLDRPSAATGLEELVTDLRATGADALALAADVTDAAAVEAAVADHVRHFGGIDVMVTNAGLAITAGSGRGRTRPPNSPSAD